ncbi:MAG: CoA pyrophosphatase [Magnetococcales bacterium]|nr:CoA pyrophosphatase [Magnetococcales bacterium]MBF0438653.1 CoA pyrophosphatase [Magnetococcales bacterium]
MTPTYENNASSLTQAAVLLPLIGHEEVWHLLFIRRTLTVSHHKGQIAFPGGRAEHHDSTPLATALRETREELGLDPRQIHILGKLPPVPTTQTGFLIHPFVGILPLEFQLRPDPREVASTLTVPLDFFLNSPERSRAKNRYNYQNEIIWGATARIMTILTNKLLTELPCAS